MKKYNAPFAEITELNTSDIITLSAFDELAGYDDTAIAPDSWFS